MAPSISFYLFFIGCLALARCSLVNLYGADPSGGLWEARVNIEAGSESTTRSHSGYKVNVFNKTINVASYDDATKKVLFHTDKPDSLYYAPLCQSNRKSPHFLTNLEVVPLNDPKMGDCVNCETSAFAYHKGEIYFLLFGEYMKMSTITRLVEIRAFVQCKECGDTGQKFKSDFKYIDVVKCSRSVVSVLHEEFNVNDFDYKEIKGAKSMKVVENGDQLSFFFQLGNITRSDSSPDRVNMSLWYANTGGAVRELHSEINLATRYAAWDMRAFGSVDYLDNYVCWNAADRMLCGEVVDGNLRNVARVLETGEAASSQVCQGKELQNLAIVSGVAIVETGQTISVVFGCYPQSPGTGGTGIVTIKPDEVKSIQPVGTRDGPLNAGSIFLSHSFDESCSKRPKPHICLGQPNPTEGTSEPEGGDSTPGGEPDDNEIDDNDDNEGEDEGETEENGIEGGHENKGSEETKAVVGESAAVCIKYYFSSLLSCLFTIYIACLFS